MKIIHLNNKLEMDTSFPIILELYPEMTLDAYQKMIQEMTDNYGQIQVWENDQLVGVSGYWIGTKLWCGRYLEMDNVVVSSQSRSKGVGKLMCDYLTELAIEKKCNMMCLDAYTDNFGAGKFYINQGFVPRGFHFIKMM